MASGNFGLTCVSNKTFKKWETDDSHFMDSIVFGDSVGTADMRRVFEETPSFQRWLDVEVALAKAQASLGMIPKEAAEIIAAKADVALIDLEAVKASGKRTGHSLLGLLARFPARRSRTTTPATCTSAPRPRTSSIPP